MKKYFISSIFFLLIGNNIVAETIIGGSSVHNTLENVLKISGYTNIVIVDNKQNKGCPRKFNRASIWAKKDGVRKYALVCYYQKPNSVELLYTITWHTLYNNGVKNGQRKNILHTVNF